MPAGSYTFDWRVVSADGDPFSGTLSFDVTVGNWETTRTPTPNLVVTPEPELTPSPTTSTESPSPEADVEYESLAKKFDWLWPAVGAAAAFGAGALYLLGRRRQDDAR